MFRAPYENDGLYLTYDIGAQSPEDGPVNQYPYTDSWLSHIATAAHGVDTHWYTRTVQNLTNANRRTMEAYLHSLIGYVWEEISFYNEVVPWERRTAFPHEYAWKVSFPEKKELVDQMCLVCDVETWVRNLALSVDLDAFKEVIDEGYLPRLDKSTKPWTIDIANPILPAGFNTSTASYWETRFHAALRYYDTHVTGPLIVGVHDPA